MKKLMIVLSTLVLMTILACCPECPECPEPEIPFVEVLGTWSKPTEGARVVRYVLDLEMVGKNVYSLWEIHGILDTFYTVAVPMDIDSLRGRVAGIDMFDRIGEFTDWDQGWYVVKKDGWK
jgi:hypothetical protein